nr:MAG TPA: hypothetical protein [Caudoviricetes sp.]
MLHEIISYTKLYLIYIFFSKSLLIFLAYTSIIYFLSGVKPRTTATVFCYRV